MIRPAVVRLEQTRAANQQDHRREELARCEARDGATGLRCGRPVHRAGDHLAHYTRQSKEPQVVRWR